MFVPGKSLIINSENNSKSVCFHIRKVFVNYILVMHCADQHFLTGEVKHLWCLCVCNLEIIKRSTKPLLRPGLSQDVVQWGTIAGYMWRD